MFSQEMCKYYMLMNEGHKVKADTVLCSVAYNVVREAEACDGNP